MDSLLQVCSTGTSWSQLCPPAEAKNSAFLHWAWTAMVAVIALCGAAAVSPVLMRSRNGQSQLRPPPQVPGFPILWTDGIALLKDMNALVDRRHAQYGRCYQAWVLAERIVFIRGWRPLVRLLAKEHNVIEGCFPNSIQKLLGPFTVPTVYGGEHKELRKLLNPTFTPKAIAACTPKVVAIMEETMAAWAAKGHLKAYLPAKAVTFQIVMRVLLNFSDAFVEDGTMQRIVDLLQTWLDAFVAMPFRIPGFGFDKGMHARDELRNLLGQLLPSAGGNAWRDDDDLPTSVQRIFHRPPHHPEYIPLEKQKDLAINLIFAGYDTCASSIHFLLRELFFNPQVLQRLREEQQQIQSRYGEKITEEAAQEMHYARACVKEVLRLHPSVAFVFRRALCDFEYEGFLIQKIFVDLRDGCMNDERWTDEVGEPFANDCFAPERWLTEKGKHTAGWLPFGAGERMCLGYQIAMSELKLWCAVMARNYEWTLTNPEAKVIRGVFMTFEDGLEIDIRRLPTDS